MPIASFRDPEGTVFSFEGRLLRVVTAAGLASLNAFLDSPAGQKLMAEGSVVSTRQLSEQETLSLMADGSVRELFKARSGAMVLEHDRIGFPSFPYEWPPHMLHAAGALTLRLAQALLSDGLGLKDATPYNVLFRGPNPVFVDVLSFERRDPRDATWLPYAQFTRTFLLPLLASKAYGLNLDQVLTTRRDGMEPEDLYRWTTLLQRLRSPFLGLVSMPTWLGARYRRTDQPVTRPQRPTDPAKARFILDTLLNGLGRTLTRLEPTAREKSTWSEYMTVDNNYSPAHFEAKERFVNDALDEACPRSVLDVGCNTGHFSILAAHGGAKVVALDSDPVVLNQLWRRAGAEKLDILPLAVNLARPTPGTGWRNREFPSFLDRARCHFDLVLMLAVVHHLLVTERIPLAEILDLAAELTHRFLVIEFVAPHDSMFQRLARGRDDLYRDLTPDLFETLCTGHFSIIRKQHVEGTTRHLYLLRKRS